MELICYLKDGWQPRIRPASARRSWMDASRDSFAYRCLPLAIANSHGWEILNPCGFTAMWSGGNSQKDVVIRIDEGAEPHLAPVSVFGEGTLTFHVNGLFRTPPGWNLWVGGLPNAAKDGIAPLGGVIETDWSPYTFTMNWRFTRPHHWIRFEENEPFAFFFPLQRSAIEQTEPIFLPLDSNPKLEADFDAWSQSRNEFIERMQIERPQVPAETWQKLYYRGVMPDGSRVIDDHRIKLRIADFTEAQHGCPVDHAAELKPEMD